jgi:hypothetical protein
MATRRYKAKPGTELVVEEVGAAVNSHVVEITIDLATTTVNEGGSTRAIKKEEVLAQIEKIRQKIITGNWLPA